MKKSQMHKNFTLKSKLQRYADGGLLSERYDEANQDLAFTGNANGGHITGPGGPTDDKVGPVMLSDGEYVLPADTVRRIGKENLDRLRAATHKPAHMEDGGLYDRTKRFFGDAASKFGDTVSKLRQPGAPTATAFDPGTATDAKYLKTATQGLESGTATQAEFAAAQARAGVPVAERLATAPAAGVAKQSLKTLASRAFAPAMAGYTAAQTYNTPTEQYYERFGMDPSGALNGGIGFVPEGTAVSQGIRALGGGDNEVQLARDIAARTFGFASDLGNTFTGGLAKQFYRDQPENKAGFGSSPAAALSVDAGPPAAVIPGQGSLRSQGIIENKGKFGERSFSRPGEDPAGLSVVPYAEGTAALERANAINASARAGEDRSNEPITIVGRQTEDPFPKAMDPRKFNNFNLRLASAKAERAQGLRGQDIQSRGQDIEMRGQDLNFALGGSKLRQDRALADRAFMLNLAKLNDATGEQRAEQFDKVFSSLFQKYDAEGKPFTDTVEQEAFKDYLLRADMRFKGKDKADIDKTLASLDPYDLREKVSDFKVAYAQNKAVNASQGANLFGGSTSDRYDPAVESREALFADTLPESMGGRGLPFHKYVYSNVPFTDPNVVVTEGGRAALRSDVVGSDAGSRTELEDQIRNSKRRLRRE